VATCAMSYFFRESNRRRVFVLVSDYNVIRDVVSETRGRHISLLSCGASPLRFSPVVIPDLQLTSKPVTQV
jgi:hypothetical protein